MKKVLTIVAAMTLIAATSFAETYVSGYDAYVKGRFNKGLDLGRNQIDIDGKLTIAPVSVLSISPEVAVSLLSQSGKIGGKDQVFPTLANDNGPNGTIANKNALTQFHVLLPIDLSLSSGFNANIKPEVWLGDSDKSFKDRFKYMVKAKAEYNKDGIVAGLAGFLASTNEYGDGTTKKTKDGGTKREIITDGDEIDDVTNMFDGDKTGLNYAVFHEYMSFGAGDMKKLAPGIGMGAGLYAGYSNSLINLSINSAVMPYNSKLVATNTDLSTKVTGLLVLGSVQGAFAISSAINPYVVFDIASITGDAAKYAIGGGTTEHVGTLPMSFKLGIKGSF